MPGLLFNDRDQKLVFRKPHIKPVQFRHNALLDAFTQHLFTRCADLVEQLERVGVRQLQLNHVEHEPVFRAWLWWVSVIPWMHPPGRPRHPQARLVFRVIRVHPQNLRYRDPLADRVHNVAECVGEIAFVGFRVRAHLLQRSLDHLLAPLGFVARLVTPRRRRLQRPIQIHHRVLERVQVPVEPRPGLLHQIEHQPLRQEIARHCPPNRVLHNLRRKIR